MGEVGILKVNVRTLKRPNRGNLGGEGGSCARERTHNPGSTVFLTMTTFCALYIVGWINAGREEKGP